MKKMLLAVTIFVSSNIYADTGMVVCGAGDSALAAIQELNVTLSSDSATVYSKTGDSDGKTRQLSIKNAKAVSAVTILSGYAQYKYGACVTVFGSSSKQ
jgi:hypothetical protein